MFWKIFIYLYLTTILIYLKNYLLVKQNRLNTMLLLVFVIFATGLCANQEPIPKQLFQGQQQVQSQHYNRTPKEPSPPPPPPPAPPSSATPPPPPYSATPPPPPYSATPPSPQPSQHPNPTLSSSKLLNGAQEDSSGWSKTFSSFLRKVNRAHYVACGPELHNACERIASFLIAPIVNKSSFCREIFFEIVAEFGPQKYERRAYLDPNSKLISEIQKTGDNCLKIKR